MPKELTTKQRYHLRKEQWQRVEQLASALHYKKAVDLAVAIGYQKINGPRVFEFHYRAKKGERDYPHDFWEMLSKKFPKVNLDWLVHGKGEMFTSEAEVKLKPPSLLSETPSVVMTGTAMSQHILPGDELYTTPMDIESVVVFGVPYRVTTDDGVYVRFLFQSDKPGAFILRSSHPDQMPDIIVSDKKIKKIERVKQLVRKFE